MQRVERVKGVEVGQPSRWGFGNYERSKKMFSKLSELQYKFMFRMVNSYLYEYPILPELYEIHEEKKVYERSAENHHSTKLLRCKFNVYGVLIIYGNGMEKVCEVTCDNEEDFSADGEYTIHLTSRWYWRKTRKHKEKEDEESIHATGVEDAFKKIEALCDKKYKKCCYNTLSKRTMDKISKLEKQVSVYEGKMNTIIDAVKGARA